MKKIKFYWLKNFLINIESLPLVAKCILSSIFVVLLVTLGTNILLLNKAKIDGDSFGGEKPLNVSNIKHTSKPVKAVPSVPKSTPVIVPMVKPQNSPEVTSINKTADTGYGIAAGGNLAWLNADEQKARMDGYADLGVTWVRFDMSWSGIQYNANRKYDWTAFDRLVTLANDRHINLLPILIQTPEWARDSACKESIRCRPSDPQLFADFAGAATQRYASKGVHNWEIWNEPNKQGSWLPSPNVAEYTELLAAASKAIKSYDKTATVISGSVGPITIGYNDLDPLKFVKDMYSNNGAPYFDAIGYHPYSYPVTASYKADWNAWQRMSMTANNLRSVAIANNDSAKKIWITEYGAPTGGPGATAEVDNFKLTQSPRHVSEALQAKILEDAVQQYRTQDFYGPFFWYSYKDNGTDVNSNENFFGLIRSDNSRKPAYETFKNIIKSSQ